MKNKFTLPFLFLTVAFCICIIVANLVEIKTVDLGWFTITAGLVVFPISYMINDCIVEVYGFAKARLVIWIGFAMSLMAALMLRVAVWLPGAESWHDQAAMESIYNNVPRIMAASFAAFVCGSMVNAMVMSKMKRTMKGRNFSLRAILSTLWGESVDSLVFFPVAFLGVLDVSVIISLIVSQALLKTLYETVSLPLTIAVVRRLKRIEGEDVTDSDQTSYNWWKINEI